MHFQGEIEILKTRSESVNILLHAIVLEHFWKLQSTYKLISFNTVYLRYFFSILLNYNISLNSIILLSHNISLSCGILHNSNITLCSWNILNSNIPDILVYYYY